MFINHQCNTSADSVKKNSSADHTKAKQTIFSVKNAVIGRKFHRLIMLVLVMNKVKQKLIYKDHMLKGMGIAYVKAIFLVKIACSLHAHCYIYENTTDFNRYIK